MGTSVAFNNINPRYNAWTVMYTYSGSGNFSVELDCAPDVTTPGGTPTAGSFTTCSNTVTGSNPSTQALGQFGYITFVGYTPWLQTKINSISSGNVTIIAWGFNPADPEAASGSGGCAGTAGTPCIVAGPNAPGTASTKNPVQVAGNDGTNVQAIATDTSGNTKIVSNQPANVTAAWTSGTSLNTAISIPLSGYSGVGITYIQSGVITQGTLTFEESPDNSNWIAIGVAPVAGTSSLPTTYPLTNGSNAFQMYTGGFFFFRVRLSVVIVGAGTANLFLAPSVMGTEFAAVVGQSVASNLQAQVQGVIPVGSSPTFPPVPIAMLDGGGNILAPADCTLNVNFDTNTMGDTVIIAGSGGKKLRVCKFSFQDVAGGNTEHLDQGTTAACGSGTASLWMTYVSIAAAAEDFVWPLVLTTSNSLCINLANATRVTGAITYALY